AVVCWFFFKQIDIIAHFHLGMSFIETIFCPNWAVVIQRNNFVAGNLFDIRQMPLIIRRPVFRQSLNNNRNLWLDIIIHKIFLTYGANPFYWLKVQLFHLRNYLELFYITNLQNLNHTSTFI